MKYHAMSAVIITFILVISNYKTWGSEKPNHCSRSGSDWDHFLHPNSIICPSLKSNFSFERRAGGGHYEYTIINTTEMHAFKG